MRWNRESHSIFMWFFTDVAWALILVDFVKCVKHKVSYTVANPYHMFEASNSDTRCCIFHSERFCTRVSVRIELCILVQLYLEDRYEEDHQTAVHLDLEMLHSLCLKPINNMIFSLSNYRHKRAYQSKLNILKVDLNIVAYTPLQCESSIVLSWFNRFFI